MIHYDYTSLLNNDLLWLLLIGEDFFQQILSCKAIAELLKACQSASSEIGENVINNIPQ